MVSARGHGAILDELRIDGLRFVEVTHPQTLCLKSHVHDTSKLCVILQGGVSEQHGPEILAPRPFDILLRPHGRVHANQYHGEGARSLLVELDPDDRTLRATLDGPGYSPMVLRAPQLGLQLAQAFRSSKRQRESLLRAVVREMFSGFEAQRRAGFPAWLEAARWLLLEELAAPPTLAALAARVGVHPVHLAQTFRARFGVTVGEFVRSARVFHAVELIETGAALATAAAEVGFADQSHMTRIFQSTRSTTPGAVQQRWRENPPIP